MLTSRQLTTRRIIIAFTMFCIICACAGVYFRSTFRPIPPLLDVTQGPRDFYTPIHHTFSPAQKAHVLDGDFVIVKNVDRLPDALKTAFSHLSGMDDFEMANPGEKFQLGDVIDEPGLPWRRLLFAGISKDKYFIHYEKGGRAHSYHVAVFAIGPERKVMFLWGGPGFPGAKDLTQLRT